MKAEDSFVSYGGRKADRAEHLKEAGDKRNAKKKKKKKLVAIKVVKLNC